MARTANPLVSVIVPVYNVEKYIDECLESVTGQTYKNIEIILIDDASTDKSGKKCDQWAKKDKRVRAIHKPGNGGLFQARLAGFDGMCGDYFIVVDSDDFIANDFVEVYLDRAISTGADIIVSEEFTRFYDDGKKERQLAPKLYAASDVLDNLLKNIATSKEKFGWNVWGKMYEANVYKKAQKDLSVISGNINAGEDILFSLIFAYYASETAYVPEYSGYFYRQNSQSIMHGVEHESFIRKIDSVTTVMFRVEQFFQKVDQLNKYKKQLDIFKDYLIGDSVWAIKNKYISANARLQQQIQDLQQYAAQLQLQIEKLEDSKAYKLGRTIVYPYVKTKKLLKSYRGI